MSKVLRAVGTATAVAAMALSGLVAPASAAGDEMSRAAAKATKRFAVTIKVNTAEPVKGEKLVIKGKVTPKRKAKRQQVVLQKRMAGTKKWKAEATTKTNKKAKYKFTDKPSSMKAREYRVIKPGSGKIKKGKSPKVEVVIYQWHDLTKLKRRASEATYTDQNITIDAKGLGGGFIGALWNDHGFIDFNLNRECIRLKARFGQDDRADDTAVAGISVVADGTSLFSGSFKLTESVERTLSLDKAFRVGFHWTSTNPDKEDGSGSSAAIVAPEVLCSN